MYFIRRFAGGFITGCRHHGDDIAAEDHLVFDDRQIIFDDNPHDRSTGNILPGGDFYHACNIQRLAKIYRLDFPGGYIRKAANAIQHAW